MAVGSVDDDPVLAHVCVPARFSLSLCCVPQLVALCQKAGTTSSASVASLPRDCLTNVRFLRQLFPKEENLSK